jgi:NADP-dependent 3-hydroxy acid dehydrogenase YdfG
VSAPPVNPPRLKAKNVVVTGASSGIGKAIALRLAKQEAFLHLVGRSTDELHEIARQARSWGGEADVHETDLNDDAQLDAFVEQLQREIKAIDILVHSAGVVALAPVAEADIADLDRQYRVNLRAPYLLTQKLLPQIERAKGQIVFINSGAGLNANPNWSQYAASKHGLKALADSLRAEVKPDGVRVISVYPGRTASPMQQKVHEMEGKAYDPSRFVQPDDVAAQVVSALALPPNAAVTDVSIRPGLA